MEKNSLDDSDELLLPRRELDLAKKKTGHPVKFDFQINNG